MLKKENKNFLYLIVFIVLASVAARLVAGLLYYNAFDTFWYRDWAFGLQNGLFDVYSRAEEISLDYPPVYLFCLYLTGAAYNFFGADCGAEMQMFLMKFWPILFDGLCIMLFWRVCRPYGEWTAVFAAISWAVNPSVFFNTAYWGQTDQLMAFLLVISFVLAEKKRPIEACVMFAIAGMTKYQSLFFTPVLLLYIYKNSDIKKFFKGIGAAAATVAAVFLPFMIGARDLLLFFRVYLGGAGTYKYCTFNAYNVYALFNLNTVLDSEKLFGIISYASLNIIVILAIIAVIAAMYLFGKRQNIWVGGIWIMMAIFMLATRMHERYQIIILPFALMAYVTTRNRHFIIQFCLLTLTGLVNQATVLLPINGSEFFSIYEQPIMIITSAINLIAFVYITYTCISYYFGKETDNDLLPKENKRIRTA